MADKEESKKDLLGTIKAFFSGLSKKEQRLVYIASAFLALAFFDRAILSTVNNRLAEVEDQITAQKALIQDQLRLLSYKKKILKDYDFYSEYFSKTKRTREEELTIFLKEIEELSNSDPVNLGKVTPEGSPKQTESGSTTYEVRLECSGTMEVVTNFLYKLENLPRPIVIKDLELSKPKPKSNDIKCIAIVLMKTIALSESVSFVK